MKRLVRWLRGIRSCALAPALEAQTGIRVSLSAEVQVLLALRYQELRRLGGALPSFEDAGFQIFSESNEDGILCFIFALIGATHRKLVDMGARGVVGSNSANLIVGHGWEALLIDFDERELGGARQFYDRSHATSVYPPRTLARWITPANVNAALAEQGFEQDLDLLCIDLDGQDYWIWRAINRAQPRVVVVEYQAMFGPDVAVTVPEAERFEPRMMGRFLLHGGASLPAWVSTMRHKGYRLIGCNSYCYNAFFMHEDEGRDVFPEVPVASCFHHALARWAMKELLPLSTQFDWVEV